MIPKFRMWEKLENKISDLIDDLNQQNEPEKVIIPQIIAEKIKYCKETDGSSLFHAMDYCYKFKECADWLANHEEVFARAWSDGYDIQGIKYVVTDGNGNYVCFENGQKDNDVMMIGRADTKDYVKKFNTKKEAQEIANLLNLTVQEVK